MIEDRQVPFAASYLRLCRGQGRALTATLAPEPGEWILTARGLELAGDPPRPLAAEEIVVPRLDRLLRLFRKHAEVVVIDCHPTDNACMAFDASGMSLANVVSFSPEEAALRALLFVIAEEAAQAVKTPEGRS